MAKLGARERHGMLGLLLQLGNVPIVTFEFPKLSLLYPCFKTAFCFGVVSGCFVPRVCPSSRIRPELVPKRGLGGPGLAFRTPESARKVHAKTSGP